MNTVPLTLDPEMSPPSLWDRIVADFPAVAEEWSRCINNLNRWEDQHLLSMERPSAEILARHRQIIQRLMFLGQLCALVATHPDYGSAETSEMVTASQEVLRNKLRMFHASMSEAQAGGILAEVFPEC